MKFLTAIVLMFTATQVFANPEKLEGNYSRGRVIPMSKISYEVVNTPEEARKFQNEGYTCKRVTNRYSCQKLESISEMPSGPEMLLINQAPKSLHLVPTAADYYEEFKSEYYAEWSRPQEIHVGSDFTFDTILWREITDGPTKIVFKDKKISFEFVVEGYKSGQPYLYDLGSVQHQRYTDPHTKKTAEYWGIVAFMKYETPDSNH